MMQLYWSPRSPFVRKVMAVAHETGLAERIARVSTFVAVAQPNVDLMQINPLSKIPTLVTGEGAVLYDSIVICEYLDSLHTGARLFPPLGDARWQALRRHALANNMLDILVPWHSHRLRPAAEQSAALFSAYELKIRTALAFLEQEADTLASTPVDIGHITIGCTLGYLDFRFQDLQWRENRHRLATWYAGFAQRPAMQRTQPVDEAS